jgi:uncharacterized protein (UPF0305 family)
MQGDVRMAKGIAGTCGMRTVTNLRIMASNESKYIPRKYLKHFVPKMMLHSYILRRHGLTA